MKKLVYKEKEYIECISTVGSDHDNGFCVVVNPDGNRRGTVYFKYCNSASYLKSTKVIRIMLDKCEYVFHKNEKGKSTWKLNSKDKKNLVLFLNSASKSFKNATNYNLACYFWNREMGLLDLVQYPENIYYSELDAYLCGWFDDKPCAEHPSYVFSTCKMPDYSQLPTIK